MPKNVKIYKINDEWTIKTDPQCLVVTRRIPSDSPKSKSGYTTSETYHNDLTQALSYIFDQGAIDNLGDLNKICEWKNELISKIKEFKNLQRL